MGPTSVILSSSVLVWRLYSLLEKYARDFGPFEERVWLNCVHQGPLPHVAVEAAQEAISWKVVPSHLTDDLFLVDHARRPGLESYARLYCAH